MQVKAKKAKKTSERPIFSKQAAKEWIAARESGGNYGARNGQYIGRYQLEVVL